MYVFNAHYMFTLTTHCAEIGVWGPFGPAASKIWHNILGGGGGGGGGGRVCF